MYFSSELNAVHEFVRNDAAWLNSIADDPDVPTLAVMADAIGSAVARFGLCELYDRKVGRGEALKQGEGRTKHYTQLSNRYQKRGLETLKRAISQLSTFEAELAKVSERPSSAVAAKRASEVREDLLLWFSESDLKVADMKKLEKALDEAIAAVLAGPQAFGKHFSAKLNELQQARTSANRGNIDNIPLWKMIALGVFLALGVFVIIRCLVRNRCTRSDKLMMETAAVIMGVVLLFC